MVDGSASAVLVWRFGVEGKAPDRADQVEHLALRLIGIALLSAPIYVTLQAVRELSSRAGPTSGGIALAVARLDRRVVDTRLRKAASRWRASKPSAPWRRRAERGRGMSRGCGPARSGPRRHPRLVVGRPRSRLGYRWRSGLGGVERAPAQRAPERRSSSLHKLSALLSEEACTRDQRSHDRSVSRARPSSEVVRTTIPSAGHRQEDRVPIHDCCRRPR